LILSNRAFCLWKGGYAEATIQRYVRLLKKVD